jgi:hypothetical protein
MLGCKRDRRAAPLATEFPRGDTRTVMMEPCGALPRKCLFIYLFPPAANGGGKRPQPFRLILKVERELFQLS